MIYLKLFLTFLEIGAVSFGGGYGMISLVREAVLGNGWLTEEAFLNLIAVSESTPGPIAVNTATFVGSTQAGFFGALAATLVTAAAVYAIGRFFPNEPETMPFDVNYLYGIAAGLIAYVFGRSRRSAFIAGVAGMLLADAAQAVMLWTDGIDQTLRLGGAGMLDTIVISGVSAVLFAEILGEFIERCVRGAKRKEGARG